MSIATEIQRLQQAKSDLKTSIQAKGVTVSSEAKLDDYPELVDSIQTGGGGDVSAYKDWIEGNTSNVPDGVTEIKPYGFAGENQFYPPVIPSSVTHLGDYCFYNFDYSPYATETPPLIIPDTVTSVGKYCFSGCGEASRSISITIKGVTTLSEAMFEHAFLDGFPTINPSITELPSDCFNSVYFRTDSSSPYQVVQIPSGIKTIGMFCFQNCEAKRIIVPDTVETITPNYTFYSWGALSQLQFLSSTPPNIGNGNNFINTSKTKIYVPDEAVDTYKSDAGFSKYASYIYPASEMPE